jgi:2'-5' RNA ligase
VDAAADAVREAAASAGAFTISLGDCGAFPRDEAPRALWMGVSAGGAELRALATGVDAALARRGWSVDPRPFRAHLTLARCEDPGAGRTALAALRDSVAATGSDLPRRWRSREVVLYESHLGRGPARYSVVGAAGLGA